MARPAASHAFWALLATSYTIWILTLLWTLLALGGLGADGSRLFNWHPILASGAVLAVLTPGVLVQQPSRHGNGQTRDWRIKVVHGFCMVITFVVLSVAISVAYSSHVQQAKPNFYSLHSWLGLGTIFLMKGNIIAGLTSTVCVQWNGIGLLGRSHRLGGIIVCLMAFVSMTVGFAEMQMNLGRIAKNVWQFKVVTAGILGVATMCVGSGVVCVLVSREQDRRFAASVMDERIREKTAGDKKDVAMVL